MLIMGRFVNIVYPQCYRNVLSAELSSLVWPTVFTIISAVRMPHDFTRVEIEELVTSEVSRPLFIL